MYSVLRSLLFQMEPETAHDFALKQLNRFSGLNRAMIEPVQKPVTLWDKTFQNPVGLAAGLDKNGAYIDGLAALGFGFIEIGTITPKPQEGNPKPRLFRLPEHQAIINRMGFNNQGVDALIRHVKASQYFRQKQGLLGINIGKNKVTPNEQANDDYLHCLRKVYPFADYVTVNLSSPNTPGLRELQFGEGLSDLLDALKMEQKQLTETYGRYVPLVLKIAPDLQPDELDQIIEKLQRFEMDGVIATNTSVDKSPVAGHPHADEAGGLSGKVIREHAQQVITPLSRALKGDIPIIAVGGISCAEDLNLLREQADLVQIYTSFIYQGPKLIKDLAKAW